MRGQMHVFATAFWVAYKLQFIRSTRKGLHNLPWTSEWVHKFINATTLRFRVCGGTSKEDIADRDNSRVTLMGLD
jgi:hypothetical protein